MRIWLLVGVLVCASVAPTAGQGCYDLLKLECPYATSNDTVCMDVWIFNCNAPLDAFGFDVEYRWDWLQYDRAEISNTLVANWIEAAAAPIAFNRVRVGGYDLVGLDPGTSGVLIRLYFKVLSWVSLDSAVWFDPWSLEDDIVAFTLRVCEGGSIPVEGRTWGAVKALFE